MATHDEDGEVEGEQDVPLSDDLIGADMPCLRCGYNLRGLKPVGQCPECGARIEKTVEYVMARVICPVCMRPNHPSAAICVHCKSPMTGAGALASYWKTAAISDRRGREDDDEPEAPSAAWAFMCWAVGLFVLYLGLSAWAVPFMRERQDAETRVPVIIVLVFIGLLLTLVSGLLIVLPTRQYLRLRREHRVKLAAWQEREESRTEKELEDEAEEGEPEEEVEGEKDC